MIGKTSGYGSHLVLMLIIVDAKLILAVVALDRNLFAVQ